jgi:hypothetical protein
VKLPDQGAGHLGANLRRCRSDLLNSKNTVFNPYAVFRASYKILSASNNNLFYILKTEWTEIVKSTGLPDSGIVFGII